MAKHVHAELMAQYAQDALETDRPWERWEFRNSSRKWKSKDTHPDWNPDHEYRRKPRKVEVAGEVFDDIIFSPEEAPQVRVFFIYLSNVTEVAAGTPNKRSYQKGLVHTTYEGALRHLEALKPRTVC